MTTTYEQSATLETLDERYAVLRLIEAKQFAWLHESVARHGLLHPVIVNAAEDGKQVVLDGFKRLASVAILDRLIHHGHLLTIEGPSDRAAQHSKLNARS